MIFQSRLYTKNCADFMDGSGVTNERGENHIDALLNAKEEIRLVFFRDSGQVNIGAG